MLYIMLYINAYIYIADINAYMYNSLCNVIYI